MNAGRTELGPARQDHLDGMRAAASLYVVLFHAVMGFPRGELSGLWRLLKRASAFGHEAVAVFIVLSGYCLMLPVVRRGGDRLPRSVGNFFARRAFRILPPYYVTVTLSLLLIASVRVLGQPGSGTIWDDSLPGFGLGSVGSHLLVIHNWFPAWAFQIDGPLWSVATEWQIYFFFPLLLLPVWRRFGLPAALLVAVALGYAPLAFVPKSAAAAIPWYLAHFALGMGAAAIVHSARAFEKRLREGVPWAPLSLVLWAVAFAGGWGFGAIWFRMKPLTDLLLGVATAAFLVNASAELGVGKPRLLTRWLGSRPAVALGHMSYSLYLTHLPVLALCHFALLSLPLSPQSHALALLALGTPLSLLCGWLFYLGVERHFIGAVALPWRAANRTRAERPITPGE
jgi:peptidoglycan/LPS O-acetylase OafA/YrhL